jgi:hypothetical protein
MGGVHGDEVADVKARVNGEDERVGYLHEVVAEELLYLFPARGHVGVRGALDEHYFAAIGNEYQIKDGKNIPPALLVGGGAPEDEVRIFYPQEFFAPLNDFFFFHIIFKKLSRPF